jgi:hypothetical protein
MQSMSAPVYIFRSHYDMQCIYKYEGKNMLRSTIIIGQYDRREPVPLGTCCLEKVYRNVTKPGLRTSIHFLYILDPPHT